MTYAERRAAFTRRLTEMSIPFINPQGTFYVFADISETGMTSAEFCFDLLKKASVLILPGSDFGQYGEGFVRFSLLAPAERLLEGLERLEGLPTSSGIRQEIPDRPAPVRAFGPDSRNPDFGSSFSTYPIRHTLPAVWSSPGTGMRGAPAPADLRVKPAPQAHNSGRRCDPAPGRRRACCRRPGTSATQVRILSGQLEDRPILPVKREIPKETTVEPIDQSLALRYHLLLKEPERDWYHRRGINNEAIEHFQLGYGTPPGGSHPRYTIPVYQAGQLVNVRFRRDDRCPACDSLNTAEPPKTSQEFVCRDCGNMWIHPDDPQAIKKYSGIKGHNQPWLFNVDALAGAESAFIVEGELDAIVMWQQGYTAVSATAGANSFSLSWGVHFLNVRHRYTVFDEDDGGRDGAAKVARMVPMGRDIHLNLEMDKADIAEFLLDYRDGEAQGAHSRGGRCLRDGDRFVSGCLPWLIAQIMRSLACQSTSPPPPSRYGKKRR